MTAFETPDLATGDLKAAVALARQPSFAAAAERLGVSQSSLTRAIKRLERALGVSLFTRSTRRVQLTAAGREFVVVAERVLLELDGARERLSEAARAPSRLTISTYSAFAANVLPGVVRQHRKAYPSTDLLILEGRQQEIIEDVRNDIADFGVGYVDSIPDAFVTELLRREPLCLVMPTRHPLAARRRQSVPVAELDGQSFVSLPAESFLNRLVQGAAADAGAQISSALTVTRFLSMFSHVAAGVGLAVLPEGALPMKPWTGVEVARLAEPSLSVSVGFITRRDRYTSAAGRRMMALIRTAYRQPDPVRRRSR